VDEVFSKTSGDITNISGQKRKRSEGSGIEVLGKGRRAAAIMGIFALVAVFCFVGF
jgi:hypothetical protein